MHVPVLLERVTELLAPACSADGAVLVDATLGLAGHSIAMLDAHPGLRLIGLDRDPEARAEAARRIEAAGHADRATLVPAVFDELPDVLDRLGIDEVQGVLFDLGVSSLQLDRPERGFSYSTDAPLDMRMDPGAPRTAADVVNTYSPKDLARVLRVYGEERFASRIAAAIDRERAHAPLTSTARLAELVRDAIPAATRRTGGHPAKRTFQALRIEVNDELGALERALPAALDALAVGGRVVVLTFHSLEDRIVKQTLAAGAADRTPPELPVPVPELGTGPAAAHAGRRGRLRGRGGGQLPRPVGPRPGRRADPEGGMSDRAAARSVPPRSTAPRSTPPRTLAPRTNASRTTPPRTQPRRGGPTPRPPELSVVAPTVAPTTAPAAAGGPRQPATRRAPFVLLLVALLVGTTLGLLILNTAIAVDSLKATQLQAENAERAQEVQRLEQRVVSGGSPAQIASAAVAAGLVPAGPAAYLVIAPDGTVDAARHARARRRPGRRADGR